MQVIQIRGGNACGKTTTVRQFVQRHNLQIQEIEIDHATTYISTNNKDIVVLGRYDKLNGGCDLFKSKKQVIDTLIYVMTKMRPRIIIFEGFIYGLSVKMGVEVNSLCKMYRYKYTGITLVRSRENSIKLLQSRNGGAEVNIDNVLSKYKSAIVSHKGLVSKGVNMKMINSDNIPIENMWKIIDDSLER